MAPEVIADDHYMVEHLYCITGKFGSGKFGEFTGFEHLVKKFGE